VSSHLYSAKQAETKMVRGNGGMKKNIKVAYFRLEIQIIQPQKYIVIIFHYTITYNNYKQDGSIYAISNSMSV
jgi:hypothetical protein